MSPTFADLGVPTPLVERLRRAGITDAFPIQAAALPDALEGRDIVGRAATGSGKTLAFGLALLSRLTSARPHRPTALVLTPTRELAAQIQRELAALSSDPRRILSIYGGTPYNAARKALKSGIDVVVACPGRLEDLLEQNTLTLSEVTTVVVDEADRMADMGFLPAVRRIINATSPERHTMLFSATMGAEVSKLIATFTTDAVVHDVVDDSAPSDVDHFFWKVNRDERVAVTADILDEHERAIVFSRTKHGADRLARQLGERGIASVALHGDRSQAQRERALKAMASGRVRVLVATDVAARGIHIDDLPAVVHFDPPIQAEDYIHRSGRTGRAGASGVVITLVSEDVVGQVRRLQRAVGFDAVIEPRESAPALRFGDTPSKREPSEREEQATDEARPRARRERPRSEAYTPAREYPNPRERSNRRERTSTREHAGASDSRRTASSGRRERVNTPTNSTRPGEAVVTFFNGSRGFGFASDGRGDDLFIHFSQIVGDGYRTLNGGQRIRFDEAQGPRGREARNVRLVQTGRDRD